MESLEFLTEQSIPVKIGDQQYVLKEASAETTINYRQKIFNLLKIGADGKPTRTEGVGEVAGMEPYFVSKCLFTPEGEPVSEEVIRKFPYRIQKALFDKAQEISGMTEDESPESLKEKIDKLQSKLNKTETLPELLGK